jgi:hypothetical protein
MTRPAAAAAVMKAAAEVRAWRMTMIMRVRSSPTAIYRDTTEPVPE